MNIHRLFLFIALLSLMSCGNTSSKSEKQAVSKDINKVETPEFSADSAYRYVEEQLAFGSRVPGSEAHKQCLAYFCESFKRFGVEAEIQEGSGILYNGERQSLYNVIAHFNPNVERRILVCAHWDCRPWCDEDDDPKHHNTPVMGANDGASGVAVIMELCRTMATQMPEIGVDFVLFDLEDSGTPSFYTGKEAHDDTWCLGSQYWARTLRNSSKKPMYGILLDMVGAPGAQFHKEGISMYFAPHIVEKIWDKAYNLGFANLFINNEGGMITDDHLYVNTIAGIPCANIIQHSSTSGSGFGEYWHTTNDNMTNIDRNTLHAVGRTILEIIYSE